jgi:hypothetical protein
VSESAQDRGRVWEREGARLVGGQLVKGSGNRFYARGDVRGRELVWSFKATDHLSSPVNNAVIADALSMALGPHGTNFGALDVIAYKLGNGTTRVDLDLMEFVAILKAPPELIPATAQENLRHTARTLPHER